jgi:hypothetical protein
MTPLPHPSNVIHGGPATDRNQLTVAIAPSSAHPRLVRIRVDEVAVGDLCFRTNTSRDRVIDALVHHAGAEVRRERELITHYDPELFEHTPETRPHTERAEDQHEPGTRPPAHRGQGR